MAEKMIKIEMPDGSIIYAKKAIIGIVDGYIEGSANDEEMQYGIIIKGTLSVRESSTLHQNLSKQLNKMIPK